MFPSFAPNPLFGFRHPLTFKERMISVIGDQVMDFAMGTLAENR